MLLWLAFVLPGTPYFLDKSGRIKRSILGSVFSTIRAETAAPPNRMALVMAFFFLSESGAWFDAGGGADGIT